MLKLSRHFSVATVAVVIASALLACLAYRHIAASRLIDSVEANNTSLTRATVRQAGARLAVYIAELEAGSVASVTKHPEAHALRAALGAIYQDFPLVGWSVYDARGNEVLSDALELRGDTSDSREAAAAALTRQVRSDLALRYQREGIPAERRLDVVVTYAPLANAGVRGGEGVLVLRAPVTEQWLAAQRLQPLVFIGVALIGMVLYAMMALALRRAEHATRFEIAKKMASDEVVRRTMELLEQQNREKGHSAAATVVVPHAAAVTTSSAPATYGDTTPSSPPASVSRSVSTVPDAKGAEPATNTASVVASSAPVTISPGARATVVPTKLATLEAELRTAHERGQFLLHFQPIVSLLTNEIVGAEALVRWEHPERGLLCAGEFMPTAEKTGLIVPIGERVLERACQLAGVWSRVMPEPIFISVNLSAYQFDQPRALIGAIQRALSRGSLPAGLLELEVTQALLARRSDETLAMLRELRSIGVRLTVHDFGTSLSDLLHVRNYPINTLKIDRALLQNVPMNANDTTIVRSLVAMARGLGLSVAAQGLERKDHIGLLVDMGCAFGQGEAFGNPMMADDFFRLLVNHHSQPADRSELVA